MFTSSNITWKPTCHYGDLAILSREQGNLGVGFLNWFIRKLKMTNGKSGTVVLAEFSAVTGNTGAVARRLLEKLPTESDSRLCFSQDRYIFHILRSDGLAYLCMANDTFGNLRDDKQFFVDHPGAVPITTAQNVKAVFDAAIRVVLQPPKQKKKKSKAQKACSIL
ncbi:unnamed protein product [Vicia faba]|uniref:Longin domain-containing protein n=1 Tax=Vicia faba TaxID=3906 RepID=A0AAV1BAB0_VICFA|nr:unnamed protein product [Vicia faba]